MDLGFANLTAKQIAAKIKNKELLPAKLGEILYRQGAEAQKRLNLFISFGPQHLAREIKRVEQLLAGETAKAGAGQQHPAGETARPGAELQHPAGKGKTEKAGQQFLAGETTGMEQHFWHPQPSQHPPGENGALLGVPTALADNIATGDQKTTCASRLLADYQPPFEARVVTRLKESGAVIVGKTNLEEFNLGCAGDSSFFNATKNPWHTESGAGSGAAAAVASGLATLALASDTRGELRQAAAYCGVMALKPTYGRISRHGLIDGASSLEQIGLLSRQAQDLALALELLAVPEPDHPAALQTKAPAYLELLEKMQDHPQKAFKIAIPACWNEAPYLQDAVKEDFQEQLAHLEKFGMQINFVTLPHFKYASLVATMISAVEAFSNLSNMDGVRFGHRETGEHLQAMYLKTRSAGFSSKLKKFITLGGLLSTPKYYDTYFRQAQKMRTVIARELENCLQENDLLLTPTTPFLAPLSGSPAGATGAAGAADAAHAGAADAAGTGTTGTAADAADATIPTAANSAGLADAADAASATRAADAAHSGAADAAGPAGATGAAGAASATNAAHAKEFPDPAAYYTAAANLSGFPSLSFPLNHGAGTLPRSLLFTAKKENETALLQIASLLEKELSPRWPKFALAWQEV